jgi:prolipoprotein diacylglyceryl transferase
MVWDINPVAISIGNLSIHWYGIFFASGLLGAYFLGEYIFKKENLNPKLLEPFFIYLIIGITIGARLAHVLFYDLNYFKKHPIEIFYIWQGGLASHGGVIGAIVAIYIFCKKYKIDFSWMLSRSAFAAMILAPLIRLGNFFNSEIVGLPTKSAFGVIFKRVDNIPRHPVVLYESISYFLIFLLLFYLYKKLSSEQFTKIALGLVLFLVFLVRFILEYLKTPQSEFANILPLSMGQILSLPFIVLGLYFLLKFARNSN